MNNIWVIADNHEYAFELISKATTFNGKVTAFVIGDQAVAEECFAYGANEVKLSSLPAGTTWEQYGPVIAKVLETEKPELVLVSATRRGKTIAAYIAGLLDWPCVTESKDIKLEGSTLSFSRTIYGGLAEKELAADGHSVIVTVAPGTFDKVKATAPVAGYASLIDIPEAPALQIEVRKDKEASTVNLSEADVVIGVGRGFGTLDNMKYAEELASLLGGELACSRPVTEDLHWLPEERYIGISGAVIKPNLYLCAGVSGQIQHVYGIRDSKTIVAIDKNENAPIFKVADYYIVGDLAEVLPELISALK